MREELPRSDQVSIVKKKLNPEKKKNISAAQRTIDEAARETPYEDAPISSFLAKIGEELGIEDFNVILVDANDSRYADTFAQLEAWLTKNGFK